MTRAYHLPLFLREVERLAENHTFRKKTSVFLPTERLINWEGWWGIQCILKEMIRASAQISLLICCYFPCARQADIRGSKQGKTILQCHSLFACLAGVWMGWGGCFGASLSFLLLSALCPSLSFPRHSSSTSRCGATVGSKFTCWAEKITYLLHFYRSPSSSIVLYVLPCNLSSFKCMVALTSALRETRPGNGAS